MSRYQYDSGPYIVVVGYDPVLTTFFAQVWNKALPSTEPLLWCGANGVHVSLSELRAQLKPYGGLSPTTQIQLLRDQDQASPLPFGQWCRALVELCLQAKGSRLQETDLPTSGSSYVVINQEGWHLYPWQFASQRDALEAFAREVYGVRSSSLRTEEVFSYISDRDVILHVNEEGMNLRLPIYAGVTMAGIREGALLSGPVIVSGARGGLTAVQLRTVQHEVFVVVEELREGMTDLWYRGWETLARRPL